MNCSDADGPIVMKVSRCVGEISVSKTESFFRRRYHRCPVICHFLHGLIASFSIVEQNGVFSESGRAWCGQCGYKDDSVIGK